MCYVTYLLSMYIQCSYLAAMPLIFSMELGGVGKDTIMIRYRLMTIDMIIANECDNI